MTTMWIRRQGMDDHQAAGAGVHAVPLPVGRGGGAIGVDEALPPTISFALAERPLPTE
jgi:hypothetical protein